MSGCFRVDTLVANFPNRLETKLEMSLSHRRELNNLIRHESSTVDQVILRKSNCVWNLLAIFNCCKNTLKQNFIDMNKKSVSLLTFLLVCGFFRQILCYWKTFLCNLCYLKCFSLKRYILEYLVNLFWKCLVGIPLCSCKGPRQAVVDAESQSKELGPQVRIAADRGRRVGASRSGRHDGEGMRSRR